MLKVSNIPFPHMRNENGQFIGFSSPRYTQVPDELFDELLSELTGAELKVLMYVVRRTFGFKRDSDHISLSQLVNGIVKKDGVVLDRGTGLAKDSVARATKSLVEKGILLRKLVTSPERGCEASEYSLRVIHIPLSEKHDRGSIPKIVQGAVRKSDTQETDIQKTSITLSNAVNKPIRRAPVDKPTREKHEYLAHRILETCRDKQSLAFYRKVVRLLPEQAIHEALSQVKEADQLGRIRERPGAMFTDLIKRKAKELGIDFRKESANQEAHSETNHDFHELTAQFDSPQCEILNRHRWL